jgi:hypothetical protein
MNQVGESGIDTNGGRAAERLHNWLKAAEADADRRGLPELKGLLRLFAAATVALRSADWNDRDA